MSKKTKSKRFISIRLRLFLQVGAIVLIAVMLILALNKWYLSSIYILNQKRTMQYLAEEIDTYDVSAADYSSKIALLEKRQRSYHRRIYVGRHSPLLRCRAYRYNRR